MNAERAYVGIQHRQKGDDWPEDFSFHPCKDAKTITAVGPTCYRLHIRIVNTGKTPAHIEGGGIQCAPFMDDKPFSPPVNTPNGRGKISPNFLHAGGHYWEKLTYELTEHDRKAIDEERMWLVGYVLYKDSFGRRHRAGFCRRVGKGKDPTKNNLFVDHSCKDNNYDYEIDAHDNRKADNRTG